MHGDRPVDVDQMNFDYSLPEYLPYVLLFVLAMTVLVVLDKVFDLKSLIWPAGPATAKNPETKFLDQQPSSFNPQDLRTDIDRLKADQKHLMDRVISVQTEIGKIQIELASLRNKDPQFRGLTRESPNSANPSDSCLDLTTRGELDTASDMTELYNASRTDQSSRARFREMYKPFFINVANDVDRRRNASLSPDFQKEVDGSYLAVPQEADQAMVYPNFTLVVVDAVYGPGALGEVFDCGTFDRRFSYPYIHVAMPATFKLTGGHRWKVTQKGKLDLGPGQDD